MVSSPVFEKALSHFQWGIKSFLSDLQPQSAFLGLFSREVDEKQSQANVSKKKDFPKQTHLDFFFFFYSQTM